MDGGYELDSRKMACNECNVTDKGKICQVRIERFPQVMEMRMEFKTEELQNAVVWRDILVPRYLYWSEIRYAFKGMIIRDSTKGLEHFSSYVMIDNELYAHHGDQEGLLRLSQTRLDPDEGFSLSTAIPKGSNKVPSRFYYLKENDREDPGEWTEVRIERRPITTGPRETPVETDKEPDLSDDAPSMDIDDSHNGWPLLI